MLGEHPTSQTINKGFFTNQGTCDISIIIFLAKNKLHNIVCWTDLEQNVWVWVLWLSILKVPPNFNELVSHPQLVENWGIKKE